MSSGKHSDTQFRQPLLSDHSPQPPQYVVVLPPYLPPHRSTYLRREFCWNRAICSAAAVVVVIAATWLLWPSDPEMSVVRMSLDRLHFHTRPQISLDVTLNTTLRVQNKDFYSVEYDSLRVAIDYRGERLGFVTSDGGRIRARGSSYVNAAVRLDAVEVLSEVILLLEDLTKGAIEFDTQSEISGKLGLFILDIPLKAKISCEVIVNTRNQTIAHQNCYPE